ncbi:hypothetical protein [Adhaeribacter aquaticus]|uniref:hypothetical protein n=1 Tax=Adhaeribacter aquaticus TaxID=299567 RepID=UPI000405F328|nr:hypothetical protein [Adhaeribacter aquaticus]
MKFPAFKLFIPSYIWLLFICLFSLFYFFAEHEGLYFYDDYTYSSYAHKLTIKNFAFDGSPFCHRFLVFFPTAVFYILFGVNAYTTTLWPLLCTLGFYLAIWLTFHKNYPSATSWMLVLSGLYYFVLNTINYLYPDNIALFFTTVSLLLLYETRQQLPVRKAILLGAFFALLNLLNFLTKETILYLIPLYITVFLYDCYNRNKLVFWITAGTSGILLLICYLLFYKYYTGHSFLRIHDIEAYSERLKLEYLANFKYSIIPRLTYQPLLFFVASGLAVPFTFAATIIFTEYKISLSNLQNPVSFWFLALITMLLSIWFGSVSFDHYKPMSLLPRMFHPLLPTFCIVAGLAIVKSWHRPITHLFLAGVFATCTVVAPDTMKIMYGPLTLFFGINYFSTFKLSISAGILFCTIILSIRPMYFIWKPTVSNYFEQERIIQKHLNHKTGTYLVITDWVLTLANPFFYGFNPPSNYSFVRFDENLNLKNRQADTIFLLINNGTLTNPEHGISIREKDILMRYPTAQLLMKEGKVKLFIVFKSKSQSLLK